MTNSEIEKAAVQVEKSQAELQSAMGSLEDSLKETSQKVSQVVEAMKKYPGLIWAVAGAIGATAAIDFFTNSGRLGKKDKKISNLNRSSILLESDLPAHISLRVPD